MTNVTPNALSGAEIKSCCARLYELDLVRLLLGDSYHPGGIELTSELGRLAGITSGNRVLDVASGTGSSAIHLARTLECRVVGIDYSEENVGKANEAAAQAGLSRQVRFERGDSERLPVDDGSFDAILCECAFCTFPDKTTAASEFRRVLSPNGRVALSDITREATLPEELETVMAWAACIADAQSLTGYGDILTENGLSLTHAAEANGVLEEMLKLIRTRLMGLEIAVGLGKLDLGNLDFASAKSMARAAQSAIESGQLGYGVIIAEKT